jgi:hypothetical protein
MFWGKRMANESIRSPMFWGKRMAKEWLKNDEKKLGRRVPMSIRG